MAFVKVWKCILIHDLPASGGVLISSFRARGHYNKESKQLRFLATYVNRKFAIFSC